MPYYKVREKENQEWLNANCYKAKKRRDETWKKVLKKKGKRKKTGMSTS